MILKDGSDLKRKKKMKAIVNKKTIQSVLFFIIMIMILFYASPPKAKNFDGLVFPPPYSIPGRSHDKDCIYNGKYTTDNCAYVKAICQTFIKFAIVAEYQTLMHWKGEITRRKLLFDAFANIQKYANTPYGEYVAKDGPQFYQSLQWAFEIGNFPDVGPNSMLYLNCLYGGIDPAL
jgi:hypothetical protein